MMMMIENIRDITDSKATGCGLGDYDSTSVRDSDFPVSRHFQTGSGTSSYRKIKLDILSSQLTSFSAQVYIFTYVPIHFHGILLRHRDNNTEESY
jgi:hypothetical protein